MRHKHRFYAYVQERDPKGRRTVREVHCRYCPMMFMKLDVCRQVPRVLHEIQ